MGGDDDENNEDVMVSLGPFLRPRGVGGRGGGDDNKNDENEDDDDYEDVMVSQGLFLCPGWWEGGWEGTGVLVICDLLGWNFLSVEFGVTVEVGRLVSDLGH